MKVAAFLIAAAALVASVPGAAEAQTPTPQTAPAQKPAAPAAAAPAKPAVAFPAGAKIAVVDLQQIANESAEGKAASAKIQSLNQKKVGELNEMNKELQAAQQKLVAGALLTDSAKAQIQREIDRLNRDIQRFTQDAQAEIEDLQQQVQVEFQRKLMPIIELVAVDKGVQIVFASDTGLVWSDTAVDLTAEVIRRFDGAMGVSSPKPPSI
jgi:outer membrane protein